MYVWFTCTNRWPLFAHQQYSVSFCCSLLAHSFSQMYVGRQWGNLCVLPGRQWVYQTCTEFGFYQSTDSPNQPFTGFPLEWVLYKFSNWLINMSSVHLLPLNLLVLQHWIISVCLDFLQFQRLVKLCPSFLWFPVINWNSVQISTISALNRWHKPWPRPTSTTGATILNPAE